MLMQEFNALTLRLRQLKQKRLPRALAACVYKKDLLVIIDKLLHNETMLNCYKALAPNSAVRFNKENYNLPRTVCVLRGPDGKFQCILETKSKTNKHTKHKIEVAKGGFKTGKPAWRLDGEKGVEPYFSLLLPLEAENLTDPKAVENIAKLKAEVSLAWELDKDSGMQRNRLGAIYKNKKDELVASIYSKQGTPLNKALKERFPITFDERNEIAISLLKTTAHLHEQNLVFQDFKPQNILLFRKKNGKLKVKLTDPGHLSRPSKPEISVATSGYESPEIALAHSVYNSEYYNYFADRYKKSGNSLGKQLSIDLEKKLTKNKDLTNLAALRKHYLQANPSNDMWALGTTLYKLFRSKKPKKLPTEKLFACFFADRQARLTAQQTLDLWLQSGGITPRTKLQPK